MNQEKYDHLVEKLFSYVEEVLENTRPPVEWDLQEGVLVIEVTKENQIIISRQTVAREVWLASPLGAYHFQATEQGWITRQGEPFSQVLTQIFDHFHIQVLLC